MAEGWEAFDLEDYNYPRYCVKCNGMMIFKGVGEYECERCGFLAYDDYGKVRNFIERRPGANTIEIEAATGVAQRSIRKMLRDGRFMLTEDSKMMLHCDVCRRPIRFGKLCPECEKAANNRAEVSQKTSRRKPAMAVYGMAGQSDSGQKRFKRGN